MGPVVESLAQQSQRRAREPALDLGYGRSDRTGSAKDPRMRDDPEELVQTRPGNRPRGRILREAADRRRCTPVTIRVAAMGGDEDVRVDGDHERSESNRASRIRSQLAPSNSGFSPS